MTPERLAELRRMVGNGHCLLPTEALALLDHIDELEKRINAMDAEDER